MTTLCKTSLTHGVCFSDRESDCVFVPVTGCERNPGVSSWEETQLEWLTLDTAAVHIAE